MRQVVNVRKEKREEMNTPLYIIQVPCSESTSLQLDRLVSGTLDENVDPQQHIVHHA